MTTFQERVRQFFREADKVCVQEEIGDFTMWGALREWGCNDHWLDFSVWFDRLDHNKNRKITCESLINACRRIENDNSVPFYESDLPFYFMLMDKDGNGTVDKKELSYRLKQITDFRMSDAMIDNIFDKIDTDHNNQIDFREYLSIFRKIKEMKKHHGAK